MYYGYRCYNSEDKPIGWLYTFNNNIEYAWTERYLDWCKRWKTERGAKNNFDNYNSRWQIASKGGYLKIEVMPDMTEPESKQSRRQRLLEEWGDTQENTKYFKYELIEGLPEEYGVYLFLLEDGSIKEGYFGSFPVPHHQENTIRIANCEDEEFYYEKCVGWLKKVE